jgi:hypothetical protein
VGSRKLQTACFSVAAAFLVLELVGLGLALWRRLSSLSGAVHPQQ